MPLESTHLCTVPAEAGMLAQTIISNVVTIGLA